MGTPHRQEITDVFHFDQLSDAAKEKAREWYREAGQDDEWWDGVYGTAEEAATLLGITIATKPGTLNTPCIYFSGFWSQGDGACFEGDYAYRKGSLKAIKDEFPTNEELINIAQALQNLQKCFFYRLTAVMDKNRHNYCHSGTMDVQVDGSDSDDAYSELKQLMRDFADWIYNRLEKEYDWLNSDEVVDENITANEYEFDAQGSRI